MKRQIKFRAKGRYTGEWVSGSLLHYNLDYISPLDNSITTFEFCYILENAEEGGRRVEVDKNTIGQFTGLYDKATLLFSARLATMLLMIVLLRLLTAIRLMRSSGSMDVISFGRNLMMLTNYATTFVVLVPARSVLLLIVFANIS